MLRRTPVILCLGSSCFARGNSELIGLIRSYIIRNKLEDKVDFKGDHCFDNCSEGPNLSIGGRLFDKVSRDNLEAVLDEGLQDIL